MKEEINVKKWYGKEFPSEKNSFAKDIDKDLTFEDIYKCLTEEKEWNERTETIIHKFDFDSDVRNRIVEEINNRYTEIDIFEYYETIMDDMCDKI